MDLVARPGDPHAKSTTRSRASSPTHEILVSPTLACMPVDNADRRQHHGPDPRQRRRGRPADRLVPDLSHQLQRPSVGLGPGGAQRRPAGRHAAHRPALRRCRRARRGGSVRTPAAVARPLSHLRRAPGDIAFLPKSGGRGEDVAGDDRHSQRIEAHPELILSAVARKNAPNCRIRGNISGDCS